MEVINKKKYFGDLFNCGCILIFFLFVSDILIVGLILFLFILLFFFLKNYNEILEMEVF